MLLGEYNVGPGKKPQHIKNSKQLLTIQHQTQNINKQLLVSHIKTQDTTKAWDGGSPEELLCLALNQCFSSQDVIVIPQQGCHGEVLDWVPVGVNNHQVSEEGRGSRSSERLPAEISGEVVTATALVQRLFARERMQQIMIDEFRASSRLSMDTTHSVCPFWSPKRSTCLCKATSFSKMLSILRLMTTV